MATREQISLKMLVQPEMDQKAASRAIKDAQSLHKKLSKLKVDWSDISKASGKSIKELRNITSAAENFSKSLSKGAQASFKEFAALGDQLEKAHDDAARLSDQLKRAKGVGAKKEAAAGLGAVQKQIAGLNKQIAQHKDANKGYKNELAGVIKSQRAYRVSLEKAASYTGKNMLGEIAAGLKRGGGGAGRVFGAVGKGVQSSLAKKALESGAGRGAAGAAAAGGGGAGIAAAASALQKVIPILSGVAVAIGVVWQAVTAASDHQAKLNKALTEGTGTANDFVSNTENYRDVLNELRNSAINNAGAMLKFGVDSEQTLKIISAFSKESTGSLIKTRDTLASLGKGDVQRGMNEMARNAVSYGKALGMESTEVAGMMGKFVSETGYSAGLVEGAMGNIVKSAATANMPMTKFMDIFRRVLPDVELYQNRLEELTGTIKLLSKSMSPKDVQNFMDAFAKGFQGVDFKQRLKTVLITGTGFVSKTLDKDFSSKAQVMAQNFAKYAKPGENITKEFQKAYKGGEKSMGDFLAKMQGRAAQQGEAIAGTQVSNAMKLASYEATRKKGGALNMTTAMRGAGMYGTYKILGKLSQSFTKGFDGLSEHVIKQLGISEQQYEALRTTSQTMQTYRSELSAAGMTSSESMNKSLREAIATRKGIKDDVGKKMIDLTEATEEDLFTASEMSNNAKDTAITAENLALEQTTATLSISEKLSNVIAFLLEKIFTAINDFVATPLGKLVDWLMGGKSVQPMIEALNRQNEGIQASGYSAEVKSQYDLQTKAISSALKAGMTGKDLATSLGKDPAFKNLSKLKPEQILAKAKERGATDLQLSRIKGEMYQKEGETGQEATARILGSFEGLGIKGGTSSLFQELGQDLAAKYGETEEAKKSRLFRTETRRADTEEVAVEKDVKKVEAARQASDSSLEFAKKMAEKEAREGAKITGEDPEKAVAAALVAVQKSHDDRMKKAGVTPGDPAAPAAAPAGVKSSAPAKVMEKAQEESTKAVTSAQDDAASVVEKQVENVYKGVTDVAGILKKGIIFQSGFLVGPYKSVIKDASFLAFDQALVGFSTIMAKLQTDEDFATQMAGYSFGIQESGLSMKELSSVAGTGSQDRILQLMKEKGGKQSGGPIPDTGTYRLHKGEAVLDAMTYESVKQGLRGGGGGGGVTVNMTVNAAPNWTKQEFEGAVMGVMDRVARKH